MLDQKVALVTGGGSGIGQAVAIAVAQQMRVIIVGRQPNPLQQTAQLHPNIRYVVADICQEQDIASLMDNIASQEQRLDLVVNNAGIAPVQPLAHFSRENFEQIFQLNVRAVAELSHYALPLLKRTQGVIINISSGLVGNPMPDISLYTASKAAVESLTKSWAKELAQYGIRVNAVAAGATDTPLYDKNLPQGQSKEAYQQTVSQYIPLARFAQAEEIAQVVAFLASPQASYITGAIYAVDGGFSL